MSCSILRGYISIILLFFHSFFKSLLFIVSRIIIHNFNRNQNKNKIFLIRGLIVNYSFFFRIISLIRIPFFTGFFSKELILENIWRGFLNSFIFFVFFFGCGITVAYSINLIFFSRNFFFFKFNNSEFLRLNTIWLIFLCFFSLFLRNYIYFFFLKNENYINITIKIFVLCVFLLGFLFFKIKIKPRFYFNFYNPLFHRLSLNINIIFKIINIFEFFFLELKVKNFKSIYNFFRIKNLFIIFLIFLLIFKNILLIILLKNTNFPN